jgi:segregation and condensation protein B
MNQKEMKNIIECFLLVSNEAVSVEKISKVLGVKPQRVKELILQLKEEYDVRDGGIQIICVAHGYKMCTRAQYAEWLKKFFGTKKKKESSLSQSALETLAIIAYKQPIMKAEIESIRGVEVKGVLKTLLERNLIRIVGRKKTIGKPLLYGTTKNFLMQFGLESLSSLPTLEEIEQL